MEAHSNWPKERRAVQDLHLADWDDSIACQLEELLSHNMSATFRSAIKKIAECGYSEEVAEFAVLRSGLYYGSKDPVSNIVDGALVFLRREKQYGNTSRHHIFEDLEHLVDYTILEMIYVLMEVKPTLTIVEAMWFLLICDLNLSQACASEGDSLSGFFGKEICGESSSDHNLAQLKPEAKTSETKLSTSNNTNTSKHPFPNASNSQSEIPPVGGYGCPNLPHPLCSFYADPNVPRGEAVVSVGGKTMTISTEYVHSMCHLMHEKSGCRKGCLANQKRHMVQQRSFHMEKHYKGYGSKGTLRAKFTTCSGPVLDDKLKSPPPDLLGVNTKNTSSKTTKMVRKNVSSNKPSALVANSSKPTPSASKDIVCALPAANAKQNASLPQETKPIPKPTFDYYAGIPYDMSLGKHAPQDEKDKLILMLVPQIQIRQQELQGWTDWANQKVMQAARRLGKDQGELKSLRQEREEIEKFQKEKQILEENTAKRLSEMEGALTNANSQVEVVNSTADRLEVEKTALKNELEAAKVHALGSAEKLKEALLREHEVLKRAQLSDTEKILLQERVSTEKRKVVELQHVVEKAKGLYNNIEALHKHEEKVKEKLQTEASSIRKERKQMVCMAIAEGDMIRQKAENEMQKYQEHIKKLESEISELRLESESLKIAALRRGANRSYGGYQQAPPKVTKRLAVFQGNFGTRVERECVMCLAEEMTVVFLPCAHQALCANCNELHEKQGMSDCPSCRTPIKRRINVRFS